MRHLAIVAFLLICANTLACAQEPCHYGAKDAFDALEKDLSEAKSCSAAVAKMNECAFGSSADTHLAPIVIAKCEETFFRNLSPAAQKRYVEEMQLCAYQYSRQKGTMYMSLAALCQVDVAARFASDPGAANQPALRASFDCDRAQTPLEKAICTDIGLGHADIVLSRIYAGMLERPGKKDRDLLIRSEKQWLQSIPAKCGLLAKPLSLKSVNCARNEFELRFTLLDSCSETIRECLQSSGDEGDQAATAGSAPTPRASFDCEAPSTDLEIVICADAELGQTDIRLAQAYQEAGTAMIGAQHEGLVASEREWLRFVRRTCPLGAVGGVPSVLARSCVRTAFQTRIVQLQTCPQKDLQEQIPCLNEFHRMEEK